MERAYRFKHNLKLIVYAIITVAMLCATIGIMVMSIYSSSEGEAFDNLHKETRLIKRDINLQMYSDRENLMIMSNFASKLYENGESYELLFRSFEEIGLFEDVRVLMPNNTMVTKAGVIADVGDLLFEEEVKKGMYVSGRVRDLVNRNKEVVRSAVPVKDNDDNTIAIIYGIIDLQKFEDRYFDTVRSDNADLFVIEQSNGNFIIDTKRPGFGGVIELSSTTFEDGYSYEEMASNLAAGESGFVSFDSIVTGDKLYAHYAPLDFAPWQIMLAKPADAVFYDAHKTGTYMISMALTLIAIMLMYVVIVYMIERGNLKVNVNASIIRKALLAANQNGDMMYEALERMTNFAKARSAFYIDSNFDNPCYISPKYKNKLIVGKDREYFLSEIVSYITKIHSKHGTNVYLKQIRRNSKLSSEAPRLYGLLQKHDIFSIHIASVTHNNSKINMLCVTNATNAQISDLLKDIAICFSMAVYNRKHLTTTESMALTDALTGVANRMAYKNDVKLLEGKNIDRLTCIYIDVNELNYFNNKYGHSAGDRMLVFVADTLSAEFPDNNVYRMGGDEFLIFTSGLRREEIVARLNRANSQIEDMKYHISIGIKTKTPEMEIEDLVNEAEKRMYIEKAKYYQGRDDSEDNGAGRVGKSEVIKSGVHEVDAYLEIMKNKYYGIYYVSLNTDKATQILAPISYFSMSGSENSFSDTIKQYIHDYVKPEFHRTLLSFIKYDAIEQQLNDGITPRISYVKKDGEKILLTVWSVPDSDNDTNDTVWMFERSYT